MMQRAQKPGFLTLPSQQTGETVALKKVALRRLEDGIPNQALREIKALQETHDSPHVRAQMPGFSRRGGGGWRGENPGVWALSPPALSGPGYLGSLGEEWGLGGWRLGAWIPGFSGRWEQVGAGSLDALFPWEGSEGWRSEQVQLGDSMPGFSRCVV